MRMAKASRGSTPEKGSVALQPEVVEPETPEVALTTTDGSTIQQFVEGARAFFKRAEGLEAAAKHSLATMQAWKMPTNGDEDEVLQLAIKAANTDLKTIQTEWTITKVVSQFHRRLTAKRNIAETALESAANIGNGLHNRYVADAQRKAREEQDRLDREAEKRAAEERQAELERLEASAAAAEAAAPSLSEREQMFVDLFLSTGNAQASAQRAGFKDALKASVQLMARPKIADAIRAKQEAAKVRQQAVAVQNMPLMVEDAPALGPDIRRASGTRSLTTWSGEVFDEAAFIEAVISRKHGIPNDVLTVNKTALNTYARSMQKLMDRWPGVRAKSNTGVV